MLIQRTLPLKVNVLPSDDILNPLLLTSLSFVKQIMNILDDPFIPTVHYPSIDVLNEFLSTPS
jgi:hypothetical protein